MPAPNTLPAPLAAFLDQHGSKLAAVAGAGLAWYALRRYFAGGKADKRDLKKDLTGRVVIVTGANSGIGYETALQLAKQHATVCIAGRPSARTTEALKSIREKSGNPNVFQEDLDVSSLKSVRAFADRWKKSGRPIHLLINNAGVTAAERTTTEDNLDLIMATNHFGPFLLTNLLLDIIKSSDHTPRIVNVSSRAHRNETIDINDLNNRM
ncbi:hypothetical protein HK104_008082, partial [Borealophlyctis nickersoniae]